MGVDDALEGRGVGDMDIGAGDQGHDVWFCL